MSKRGSMRVRLAVAAAVLVGGGAAGVVAVNAGHGSSVAAESAGYSQTTGRTLSYTSAMSSAMNEWGRSQNTSLFTISHMKSVKNYWTQSWHHTTIFIQRGVVLAVSRGEFVVESANGTVEIWHVNNGTSTGMSAMTGGTMQVPSSWQMNTKVKGIAKGDLVFVFGERENHALKAQLVLFAAPTTFTPAPQATATVTVTPTAFPTAGTVTPTAFPTAPSATPTAVRSTFSGTNS